MGSINFECFILVMWIVVIFSFYIKKIWFKVLFYSFILLYIVDYVYYWGMRMYMWLCKDYKNLSWNDIFLSCVIFDLVNCLY